MPYAIPRDRSLKIRGLADQGEAELCFADCEHFAREHQVAEVGNIVRGRRGSALRLRGLFEVLRPSPRARWAHIATALDLDRPATMPLRALVEHGLLVYGWDGKPLSHWQGGPFHLIVPGQPYASSDLPNMLWMELDAEAAARSIPPVRRTETLPIRAEVGTDYTVGIADPGPAARALPAL